MGFWKERFERLRGERRTERQPSSPNFVYTADELVARLHSDTGRPSIFTGVNMPVVDRRDLAADPKFVNHFSFDEMGKFLGEIQDSNRVANTLTERGQSIHFGGGYDGLMRTMYDHTGQVIGRVISYYASEASHFTPFITYELTGPDPDESISTLSIRVTRYQKEGGKKPGDIVDVYQTIENAKSDFEMDLDADFTVEDFLNEPPLKKIITLSVGDPDWTERYQKALLRSFNLITDDKPDPDSEPDGKENELVPV